MELRRSRDIRKLIIVTYFSLFLIYLFIGFLPADATDYNISARVSIPSIDLMSDVTTLEVENRSLKTPDTIVGSYSNANNKTLLIGHASTVFHDLSKVSVGDAIWYDGHGYVVSDRGVYAKRDIRMEDVLKTEPEDTLVIMTCAGEDLGGGDATHRLILTAKAV